MLEAIVSTQEREEHQVSLSQYRQFMFFGLSKITPTLSLQTSIPHQSGQFADHLWVQSSSCYEDLFQPFYNSY
jgi:hypothetical protein